MTGNSGGTGMGMTPGGNEIAPGSSGATGTYMQAPMAQQMLDYGQLRIKFLAIKMQ